MKSLPVTTAAILAGGLGTRLRPAIAHQPKVLAEIGSRPFLELLLNQLATWGLQKVVLCTGYLGNQVQSRFGKTYKGMNLLYSQEEKPMGTAGALRLALPLLHTDCLLVMNGDSYCKADLPSFSAWHYRRTSEATLLLTKCEDTSRFGRVQVNATGQITTFEEKSKGAEPGLINAGIYLLSRRLINSIPAHKPVSLERDVFPAWIGKGLYGFISDGPFIDIGTPESYASAEQFFAKDVQ